MARIQELLQEREGLINKQESMLLNCQKEKRNLTVDEKSEFDKLDAAIAGIENTIDAEKRFNNRQDNKPDVGFYKGQAKNDFSFGEQLQALTKGQILNATTGHSATVPSDGGFLIGSDRSNTIMTKTFETGVIAAKCDQFEISQGSDSLEIPYVDETSRVNGSRWGGIQAYREGEVDTPTSTKTKLGLWECRVSDLKALIYVTERLLNDAPALESLIMSILPQEFAFKLDDEILNGGGGASCKGIIGDAATVSVTKESGQIATTIVAENIIKMYTRCWGKSRNRAAFYCNQDIEPELFTMALNVGTGGVPMFMPANGLSTVPYNTLFGKPIVPVEQCATLGTVGDIILADFSEYALVKKGGIKSASSMHVKFLTDEMCFKFSWRINGKPKWKNVLTPYKGSNTLSPFVTVATR